MTCFMRDLLLTGGELVDTVGFERRNRMLDASRGSRATKKDNRRQGEQADRCADPERPWKPPVSATFAVLPSPVRVLKCVAATVDAIATPIAPPSCCEVLSSPEASPASRSETPARPAIETG